jgi:hypothetical protein
MSGGYEDCQDDQLSQFRRFSFGELKPATSRPAQFIPRYFLGTLVRQGKVLIKFLQGSPRRLDFAMRLCKAAIGSLLDSLSVTYPAPHRKRRYLEGGVRASPRQAGESGEGTNAESN